MEPDLLWMKKPDSDGPQRWVAQQRALRRRPGYEIGPSSSSDGRAIVGAGEGGLYYPDDVLGRGSGGDEQADRIWSRLLGLALVRGTRSFVAVLGKWMDQVAAVMPMSAALSVRAFASVRWLSRSSGPIGLDVVGEGVVLTFGSDLEVGVETGVELPMDPRSHEIVLVVGG